MGSVLVTWPQRVLVIGVFLLFHVTQLNAQATSREEEILPAANRQTGTSVAGADFRHCQASRQIHGARFARRRSIGQGK